MNPNDAQLRAQSELQSGESIYWTGTADPRRAAIAALPAAFFGIPFAGFALFCLPFLFIGLGIVLAPLWAFLKGGSTVYAITNQRIMIITGGSTRLVKSVTPADIVSIDHRERPDGSGDIVIQTTGTNNSTSQIKVALFGIPNVKQVAQQVMTLHTQRPAA